MIHILKLNNNGFTLVEMLVALSIFSVVVSVVVGIFISGNGSQRKIIELHEIQREGGYLLETVSRELRMATEISSIDGDNQDNNGNDIGQQNNNNSSIEFTNYNGDLVRYCRSDASGACTEDDSGDFFSRGEGSGEVISSANIKITHLRFYISERFSQTQPVVTISMKIKSTGKYGTEITLQNSVAMRIY